MRGAKRARARRAAGAGASRQLRRQHRLRAQGLCIICSEPAAVKTRKRDGREFVASRCDACLAAQRVHYARKKAARARAARRRRRR